MFNDENPSYLGNSPMQSDEQPSYMNFPQPNTSGNLQPPTTQPSLQNAKINLPQVESPKQNLSYTYRAGVSPYFRNMPYQKVLGNLGNISQNIFPITSSGYFKDSSISSAFIIGGAVIGYYFDKKISKMIGAKGYGALIGAVGGNIINNSLKEYSVNGSGIQSVYGGLLPIVPLAIAGRMKKPLEGKTAYSIGAMSIAYLLFQRYKQETGE